MSHRENITRIKAVYNALEELAPEVIFVGGATVSLYADRQAGETRPTEDVDVVVELMQSKLDAFVDRGEDDGRTSSDFEDIVFLLNNRNVIWQEINEAPENVREFIKDSFSDLIKQKYIDEWISAHLEYSEQRRVNFILRSMEEIVGPR